MRSIVSQPLQLCAQGCYGYEHHVVFKLFLLLPLSNVFLSQEKKIRIGERKKEKKSGCVERSPSHWQLTTCKAQASPYGAAVLGLIKS